MLEECVDLLSTGDTIMTFHRQEVKVLLADCEQIQRLMALGAQLEEEERELIEFSVQELLREIRTKQHAA